MIIADIENKAYFLANTNSTNYPAADRLISLNNASERVASIIMRSDGRWQWSDDNNTDFDIATTTLTADQQDYALATTHRKIWRVEILDSNSNWIQLTPFDQADIRGAGVDEFMSTSGLPVYYDLLGRSILLYPAPNYTQAASLKVFFQRGPAIYTSDEQSAGTKVPGFDSLYHDLLSYWLAYDYAVAKGKDNANQLRTEIQLQEKSLARDYTTRHPSEKLRMTARNNTRR